MSEDGINILMGKLDPEVKKWCLERLVEIEKLTKENEELKRAITLKELTPEDSVWLELAKDKTIKQQREKITVLDRALELAMIMPRKTLHLDSKGNFIGDEIVPKEWFIERAEKEAGK